MANVKISELTNIDSGSVNTTDIIPMVDVDNASTKKVSVRDLKVALNKLGNSIGEGNSYGDVYGFRISGYSSNIISLSGYSYFADGTQVTPAGTDVTSYFPVGGKVGSNNISKESINPVFLRPMEILGSNFSGGTTHITASLPEGITFNPPGNNPDLTDTLYRPAGDTFDVNSTYTTMVGFGNGATVSSSVNLLVGSFNNSNDSSLSAIIGTGGQGKSAIASLGVGYKSYIAGIGSLHVGHGGQNTLSPDVGQWANVSYPLGGVISDYSLSVGEYTKAVGKYSISLGRQSLASGSNSATIGWNNNASGSTSIALGYGIQTDGTSQIGVGTWNAVGDENYGIFIIGNGADLNNRSNALRVSGSGDVLAEGTFTNGGADYAEFFESVDGTAIPNGTVVELVGDKIQPCVDASDAIGVISTNPNVLGNAEGEGSSWVNKYQKDVWGNKIYGDYEVTETEYTIDENGEVQEQEVTKTVYGPLINPDFDSSLPYISRESRPEWNKVGLLGQLKVLKNQPIPTYWKFMKDINNDIALYLVK